ncbi:MAG: type II secretion system minor pseudopilin GspJ [Candidatus Thiodiazotropha sp. (ex Dulcina madagascariensis)]|nr:type II secretion system minor pseudopilin GspJ [Candidatus Thiodiazotropha sp. (ex Dulcina madagascariensis)]MCU7925315.1 type II secretion system minor pseudopilin GspJ [Candidatus Thiodiazotropha sp. (ex Dulcina madagascariensis)]MCU7935529.1 type II secretion system minor pseudopilin GspJ [Candidatus Thiodiazotropha sp. (ex Dulcina madagascariensis)]
MTHPSPHTAISRPLRGFTLLELLIAITIFAILATFAYAGLKVVLDTEHQTSLYNRRMSKLQLGLNLMQRDIQQAVNRPIRNEHGDEEPAFMSGGFSGIMLQMTRGGYPNPMKLPRSNLQRVGYQYEENNLYRLTWPTLDRAQDSKPNRQKLIDEIASVEFFFYDKTMKKQSEWPLDLTGAESDQPPGLPIAVELTMELKDWGRIRRLFRASQLDTAVKE